MRSADLGARPEQSEGREDAVGGLYLNSPAAPFGFASPRSEREALYYGASLRKSSMQFDYQARTKEGGIQMGAIEASSKEAAALLLQKQGFYVTFLEEAEKKPFYVKKIKFLERTSRKEIVLFSRQLSILFKSGVPLLEALRTLARQAKSPFKERIIDITDEIEGGSSLSQAVSRHPKIFPLLYVNMVKSGEASGKLSETLIYLADHLEKEYQLNSKLKGAMIYPAFILATLFLVGLIMIYYILPKLTMVLEESGQELPILTQMIIVFSDFVRSKGYLIPILIFGVIFLLRKYLRTKEGKRLFDEFSLKMPIFGNFLKLTNVARFAENLSTLIAAGLPISQALEITGEVLGNSAYKKMIFETQEAVKRGETISSSLQKYPTIIPPLVIQMTTVGERTGQLDNILKNIVDFYQKELERGVDNLLSLIEPIMLVFLGLIIGVFAIAFLLPLYNMTSIGE